MRYSPLGLLCLSFFLLNAKPSDLPNFEKPPVVNPADLLPAELVKGDRYSVDQNVPTDGYLGHFVLHTRSGTLQVRGTDLLKIRISEIPAMEKLDEISKTEVFAKAAANAAMKPVKSLQKAAEDPVETVKGIPSGVGRFFKKTAKTVEKGVETVKDSGEESQGSSGDAVKELAGYNKILREWAKNLRVDPYTTNPILKKELEDVTKASFAGGFTTRVVLPSPPSPVSTVITISNLVWDLPPEDLKAMNEKKLKMMGVDQDTIQAFFKNIYFTPTTQTAFVLTLEDLKNVKGLPTAITTATKSDSEEDARFFMGSVKLLASYHKRSQVAEIRAAGSVIIGRAGETRLIVPAAIDYVSWTEEIADFAKRDDLQARQKIVLLSGKFSATARKALAQLGWHYKENFQ